MALRSILGMNRRKKKKKPQETINRTFEELSTSDSNGEPIGLGIIRRFDMAFERPFAVYFPGDDVKGELILELTDAMVLKGITARFVGEAYINFPDKSATQQYMLILKERARSKKKNKIAASDVAKTGPSLATELNTKLQASNGQAKNGRPKARKRKKPKEVPVPRAKFTENYFDNTIVVFGHKYGSKWNPTPGQKEILNAGLHAFPITYSLPPNLPSSFHGNHGYIRYYCELCLERTGPPTLMRKVYFSINHIVDLNFDHKAEGASSATMTSNLCCFCCSRGSIVAQARIRHRGFVCGEIIPINAEVANISNQVITSNYFRLMQLVSYTTPSGFIQKREEREVRRISHGTVLPEETDYWDNIGMLIPPLPATRSSKACKVIDISYRLEFVIETERSKVLSMRLPLVIGSFPLQSRFRVLRKAKDTKDSVQLPIRHYPSAPEITFEECIFGPQDRNYFYRQNPRPFDDVGMEKFPCNEEFAPSYITCSQLNIPSSSVRHSDPVPT